MEWSDRLIRNEGLFSQVIDNFPYPIAIFERSGVLIMVNQAILQKACIRPGDIVEKKIHFLNSISNENADVLDVAEDTFIGETTLLKNLKEPPAMFAREDSLPDLSDNYQSAVFFRSSKAAGAYPMVR